jgi:uncharacterized LabA/DUF88 family protein
MASTPDNISMAVFCDFENVALGVRDANYEKFDIKPVLERLLLKGSIVVKKAYCDWERYKGFKATMHEANFELIEIPHVRQSGKNSADIRLVVDALDLCYTKSHVNTFVIISGDSDFSPLVSKLRENNKQVIGVGVKQSTSDLLVANCDEFIFYDDLVREVKRAAAKRDERKSQPSQSSSSNGGRRAPDEKNDKRKEELEARKAQAIDMVVEMFDALVSERGDSGKIWASLLKDTLKRRRPEFNETYFGFRTFGNLLEEAQARGMLEFGRDEKSGAYVYRSAAGPAVRGAETAVENEVEVDRELENETVVDREAISPEMASLLNPVEAPAEDIDAVAEAAPEAEVAPRRPPRSQSARPEPARGRGRGRGRTDFRAPVAPSPEAEPAFEEQPAPMAEQPPVPPAPAPDQVPAPAEEVPAHSETAEWNEDSPFPPPAAEKRRSARKPAAKKGRAQVTDDNIGNVAEAVDVAQVDGNVEAAPAKAARKSPARGRRPAKSKES